jgi:hypothetical protein
VKALHAELDRVTSNSRAPSSRNRRSDSRSSSREVTPTLCWCHSRYRTRAQNVRSPAPTANKKTNTVDISGGTCLHPINDRSKI